MIVTQSNQSSNTRTNSFLTFPSETATVSAENRLTSQPLLTNTVTAALSKAEQLATSSSPEPANLSKVAEAKLRGLERSAVVNQQYDNAYIDGKLIADMSPVERLQTALVMAKSKVGPEIAAQIDELLKPENLALISGVAAFWGAAHLNGSGEIADLTMLGVATVAGGFDALKAINHLGHGIVGALTAETRADFDGAQGAATRFAQAAIKAGEAGWSLAPIIGALKTIKEIGNFRLSLAPRLLADSKAAETAGATLAGKAVATSDLKVTSRVRSEASTMPTTTGVAEAANKSATVTAREAAGKRVETAVQITAADLPKMAAVGTIVNAGEQLAVGAGRRTMGNQQLLGDQQTVAVSETTAKPEAEKLELRTQSEPAETSQAPTVTLEGGNRTPYGRWYTTPEEHLEMAKMLNLALDAQVVERVVAAAMNRENRRPTLTDNIKYNDRYEDENGRTLHDVNASKETDDEETPLGCRSKLRQSNCFYLVRAVDNTISGRDSTALPLYRLRIGDRLKVIETDTSWGSRYLEKVYNAKFSAEMPWTGIEEEMLQAEHGARGIVRITLDNGDTHVFNVVNNNGVIVGLDGATGGKPAFLRPNAHLLRRRPQSFSLLRTNNPSGSESLPNNNQGATAAAIPDEQ